MTKDVRIDATVAIWFEVSRDGRTWGPLKGSESAHETGRTCGELVQLLRAYAGVLEASAGSMAVVPPWVRVVMQGRETGGVLAVVPRKWSPAAGVYEGTGGEWMITDTPDAYRSWTINLIRARVAKHVA